MKHNKEKRVLLTSEATVLAPETFVPPPGFMIVAVRDASQLDLTQKIW